MEVVYFYEKKAEKDVLDILKDIQEIKNDNTSQLSIDNAWG